MPLESFQVQDLIPATPEDIYKAWLSSDGHSQMTGGKADISNELQASFTAWGGFIQGKNIELTPHSKIVQSWRTLHFPEGSQDSRLVVQLTPSDTGTIVHIFHSDLPEGQGKDYEQGWSDKYFEPMKVFFAK